MMQIIKSNSELAIVDLYLVGDRFAEFSNGETVLTVTQFFKFLERKEKENVVLAYRIHAGQGISDHNDQRIINRLQKSLIKHCFIFGKSLLAACRASLEATHKHFSKNIIISEPVRLSDNHYEAELMIDDNCAEMSDHTTGQHIQGMILIEAARQMMTAVSEQFLLNNTSEKKSFVLDELTSEFKSYIFPLAVTLILTIKNIRQSLSKDFKATAVIEFWQENQLCLNVVTNIRAMNQEALSRIEAQFANDKLHSLGKQKIFCRKVA